LCHSYSKTESPGLETLIPGSWINYSHIIIQVFVGLFQNAIKNRSKIINCTNNRIIGLGFGKKTTKNISHFLKKGSTGKMLYKNKEHTVISLIISLTILKQKKEKSC